MIPALFILHHLYLVLALFGVALLAVVCYGVGYEQANRRTLPRAPGWPGGTPPAIRLDWVGQTPVAIITDPDTSADVAAWLSAAQAGAVLRV